MLIWMYLWYLSCGGNKPQYLNHPRQKDRCHGFQHLGARSDVILFTEARVFSLNYYIQYNAQLADSQVKGTQITCEEFI